MSTGLLSLLDGVDRWTPAWLAVSLIVSMLLARFTVWFLVWQDRSVYPLTYELSRSKEGMDLLREGDKFYEKYTRLYGFSVQYRTYFPSPNPMAAGPMNTWPFSVPTDGLSEELLTKWCELRHVWESLIERQDAYLNARTSGPSEPPAP